MNWTVIILFALMSIGTLFITYFASKKTKTAGSFYTAGGGLTARQNGLALAGDFMSASTFLGLIGAFSLTGYDVSDVWSTCFISCRVIPSGRTFKELRKIHIG